VNPPALATFSVGMAPPAGSSRPAVKCDFCDMTFAHVANLCRHVQMPHGNESRLISFSSPPAHLVSWTFGVSDSPAPALLDPVPDPVALPLHTVPPPLSISEHLKQVAHVAATEMETEDMLEQPPPLMDVANDQLDGLGGGSTDQNAKSVADDDEPPPLVDVVDRELAHVCDMLGAHDTEKAASSHQPMALFQDTDAEDTPYNGEGAHEGDGSCSSGMASDGGSIELAEHGAYDDVGDLLGAGLNMLSVGATKALMLQNVFLSSTAARIRAYYEVLPEASMAVPVVNPVWASRPTRFGSPALRDALRFALTAGGSGLSERDQTRYAATLCVAEREMAGGTGAVGCSSAAFPSPRVFLHAVRHVTNRVLAVRRWQQVPITVGAITCTYVFRDIFQAGLDTLATATNVLFGDPDHLAAASLQAGSDEDDTRVRHGSLDSDLYLGEWRDVRRLHGADARLMGVQLHADEAVISWSRACYMFPVRANFINVLDNGGGWTTVGYSEHIHKPIEKTAAARLAVSGAHNDLFYRCTAVSTRTLARASETGMSAPVGGHGIVRLVPRVVGLVVDQVEERRFYALMGNRCRFFCSTCVNDRRVRNALHGIRSVDRDAIAMLDVHLAAAVVRATDPRPSRRRVLGEDYSALAFAPPLDAIHGLGTGALNLYPIASFDVLHVWKLGILRMLAQRLPAVLRDLCRGRGGARYGSVASTMDANNLRGMHLGRNCQASPAPPG